MNTEKSKKNKKIISAIVIVLTGIFLIGAFTIPINFKNSTETLADRILEFFVSDGTYTGAKALNKYDGKYMPSYIPEGYEVEKVIITNPEKTISYINTDDQIIIFEEDYPDNISIDSSEHNNLTELDINGFRSFLSKADDSQTVVIYTTDRLLTIICSDTEFDLIEFAESIKKDKN